MQLRVRDIFDTLQKDDKIPWTIIDASQTIEQVHSDIWDAASKAIETSASKEIGKLFV